MKILILFSSRDGQTREISAFIASGLREKGIDSAIHNLHHLADVPWEKYDKVVIGASIRYGHFHPTFKQFVNKHAAALNKIPSAFFSVNLVARKPEKRSPQTNSYTRKFLLSSPWRPNLCAVFPGALRYPRYRWLDRFMIRLIMKMTGGETNINKEVVYTDWQQVTDFMEDIAELTSDLSVK
ncbi:menaquinone-dependent protoporphyrinogen IX dehydrogenase [Apirhabdus apintestini]|uniref:menaquinone-dependent protoporphyrinogen IX dehydrogenase n=1 Tax=Erwinia sp. HR93 TaxID=3094840 RepID=UPI002ADEEA0D|nr:menaquinone-dependent protoporphyrinogen IX dehydrogenase [Erwinia sp. HR93]MEA1062606.1 menaquinone-dependent protoporphyrinogen IX dehydrogenase [Erwinia sp. HR93]WPM84974.1 menaquinone-dependent protoporphyrinogen IX dehydrogenase [Enterobacteriaceae bacterium CA-0114]